jgi:RNA polymerase-binding transcription factor
MAEPQTPEIDDSRAHQLLKGERDRIERALGALGGARKSQLAELSDDTDAVEAGDHIEDGGVDEAVIRSLRGELKAVERAEQRLADGGYGLSVDSGEPIPRKRLEAVPWAERTASEQKEYERVHGKPW